MFTVVNIKSICITEMVISNTKMEINMKDNILMEKDVEKVLTNLQMEICMMVNILTIFQTVLVNFSGRMEINM